MSVDTRPNLPGSHTGAHEYTVQVTESTTWYETVYADSIEDAARMAVNEIEQGRGCVSNGGSLKATQTCLAQLETDID